MAVIVDQKSCTGCGICIRACPEPNVIKKDTGKKISINTMFCKMCLLCASVCPKKAIISDFDNPGNSGNSGHRRDKACLVSTTSTSTSKN